MEVSTAEPMAKPLPVAAVVLPRASRSSVTLADTLGEVGHLGNAAGVIGDGAVGVSGEGHGEGREHAHGGDGNTVLAGQGGGSQDGGDNDDDGEAARDHADAKALDDDGGGAGLASVGDGLNGVEGVRREVLGQVADHEAGAEADDDAAVVAHAVVNALLEQAVAQHTGRGQHEERRQVDALVKGGHEVGLVGVSLGADGPEANERAANANGGQPDGQSDQGNVTLGEGDGGNDGTNERLEEISTHAGYVTNVITDVVGDGGGVAWVVLGNVLLDLADKIGTDVGGLGVDATSHAREERDGGSTETEAGEVTDSVTHVEVGAREGTV